MNILVTGGSSMIGRQVVKQLQDLRLQNTHVFAPSHGCLDLMDRFSIRDYLDSHNISTIYHLAGYNGGIEFNKRYPADIFYNTTTMCLNLFNAAGKANVSKIVSVLASCSYPDCKSNDELKEEDLWNGSPNDTVECHGLAKRNLDAFGRQIEKQYGTKHISCILTNSYGPYDSYDPIKTKVVGALIKKFSDAKKNNLEEVICWGDGSPKREFIYCEDAATGIILAGQKEHNYKVINIGVEDEVTIKELTEIIAKHVGYTGKISWDTSKNNGQMRKKLKTEKIFKLYFTPFFSLDEGIRRTVEWYNTTITT